MGVSKMGSRTREQASVAHLRVDLCIEARIPNEVDDPGLGCLLVHTQLVCKHLQVDALVYPAVRLEDQQPRILHEVVLCSSGAKTCLVTCEICPHNDQVARRCCRYGFGGRLGMNESDQMTDVP
jgi:hypothetical protein